MDEKRKNVKDLGPIIAFFILEVLAIVSFSFTSSFLIYGIFGFVITLFVGFFTIDEWKKKQTTSFLVFIIPLFLFTILTVFSNFSVTGGFSLVERLMIFFGLLSFVFLGYFSSSIKGFKVKHAFLVIYGGIFLLLAISFVYIMVLYKPFYSLTYRNMYIIVNGTRQRVDDTITMLMDFSFKDVSVSYFSLFATMLTTSLVALRFISVKNETRLFVIYALLGGFGFICLFFFPTKMNLITSALVVLYLAFIVFFPKFGKPIKAIKYVGISALALIACSFLIFFINAQGNNGISSFIQSKPLLDKIFNSNGLSSEYKNALNGAFSKDFLFGHPIDVLNSSYRGIIIKGSTTTNYCNSFLLDSFYTSGTFGVIFLVVFLVFSFNSLVRYYRLSSDSIKDKSLLVSFVGSFFIYSSISLPFSNLKYTNAVSFSPVMKCTMFLICLFLLGYSYTARPKKVSEVKEVLENENTTSI